MEGLLQFWEDLQELLPFHLKIILILVVILVPLLVSFITYKILGRKKKKKSIVQPKAAPSVPEKEEVKAAPVNEPKEENLELRIEETPTVPEPIPAALPPPPNAEEDNPTGDGAATTVMDSFSPPPLPDEPNFDFASSPTIMPFEEEKTDPEAVSNASGQIGEDDATVLMQRQPPRDSLDN